MLPVGPAPAADNELPLMQAGITTQGPEKKMDGKIKKRKLTKNEGAVVGNHGDNVTSHQGSAKKRITRTRSMLNVKNIPNMMYNGVKIALHDMADRELQKCIELLKQDTKGFGLSLETLQQVQTVKDLIAVMEADNLFSEDNLHLMQYMMHEIDNKRLWDKLEEYAYRRGTQPICLFKAKKKARGCKFVDFKIEGHVKHLKNTRIDLFRSTVCKNLGVRMCNVNLVGILDGSIILIFQMSEWVVAILQACLHKQDAWLHELEITEIKIGKNEVYNYVVSQYDKQPAEEKATITSAKHDHLEISTHDKEKPIVESNADLLKAMSDVGGDPAGDEQKLNESSGLGDGIPPLSQETFDFIWSHLSPQKQNTLEKLGWSSGTAKDQTPLGQDIPGCSHHGRRETSLMSAKPDKISQQDSGMGSSRPMLHVKPLHTQLLRVEDPLSDADSAIGSELFSDVQSQPSSQELYDIPQSSFGDREEIISTEQQDKNHGISEEKTKLGDEESTKDQLMPIIVKGRDKYELLMKIKTALDKMESLD